MTAAIGFPNVQPDRGHPLLALLASLLAIAMVAGTMLIARIGDSSSPAAGALSNVSQPRPLAPFVQEVYFIVDTPERGEAILQAEATGAADAILLGGEPVTRNVHILLVQSRRDELDVSNMLGEMGERVQVFDTRVLPAFAPSSNPAVVDEVPLS